MIEKQIPLPLSEISRTGEGQFFSSFSALNSLIRVELVLACRESGRILHSSRACFHHQAVFRSSEDGVFRLG